VFSALFEGGEGLKVEFSLEFLSRMTGGAVIAENGRYISVEVGGGSRGKGGKT
jgi:hypothetical protein